MWNIERVVRKGDYLYALVRNHPNATKNNYVLLHRVIIENHLGRLLSTDEVVHHKNGNKQDNSLDNLEVLTAKEHAQLHALEGTKEIVILICPNCGVVFERRKGSTHLVKGGFYTSCSKACSGSFSRYIQLHGITAKVDSAISENILEIRTIPRKQLTTGSVETTRAAPEMVKI